MSSRHPFTRRDAIASLFASAPLLRTLPQGSPNSPWEVTVFKHLTVIDGTGATLRDHTVLIQDDRILAVGSTDSLPVAASARVVDGRGRFMTPGLWDAHAHVSYFKASALPVLLANGVTSIRDMGGILSELDEWKTETNQGTQPGPRIYRAGPILNGKVFNEFQVLVADAAESRGAVRVLKNAKVDFVKVHAAISRDAYFGVQSECRRLGLPYVGHMPRAITPEEASDAGQLTLEHVGAFADRFASEGVEPNNVAARLERFRKGEALALFARFERNHTWFTPTLVVSKLAIHLGDHQPDWRDRYVSASCKKITAELLMRPTYKSFFSPEAIKRQEREFEQLPPLVDLMHKAGVGLLAGTDCAASIIYPGFTLHDELELLVTSGLTPMESLLTATANPARILGQSDLGIIKAGNRADLLLLDANPMIDIRNTRKIQAVISRGKLLERPDLAKLLEGAAQEAART